MESSQPLQLATDGRIAGPSTPFPAPTVQHIQGVTSNQGDVNLAGRDFHVHKHYHSYPDRVDITAILDGIRNLRKVHLDVLSKATDGTGVWLLRNEKFIIWLDPNGGLKIMWGIGIPGAGKTVLTSIVIRELEARAAVQGSRICICYVYIRYSDRADLTVRNVLEILVKQTVERHPGCALIAEEVYVRHVRERTQPTEAELLQLLHQFTEAATATFYFIDALDEAPDRIQVDLVKKLASLNVRLFITSRPLKAVEARVPDAHCFSIIAQEGDLDIHITQEIARSRDLADLLERTGSSLREEIVSLVKSKCGGMFLHASLQLEALCECATAYEVRQTLDAFPSRIEDVYLQTWHRILQQRSSHVALAKTTLVWVLNASRSMTIEELEHAVATSPDSYKFEPDRLAPGSTLMAFCRGLVTFEEESRIVRLVHYTAKGTLQGLLSDSFPHPHAHLATVCITHLMECGFQNTTIRSEEEFTAALKADPLLAYASGAWATHARNSLDVEDARRKIVNFISGSSAYPAFLSPDPAGWFDVLRPLHIIAVYNLPISLITNSNIDDPNVVTHIDQDSPLTLACAFGHIDTVKLLLTTTEIQVNFTEKHGQPALLLAAKYGHEGIVKLLLARPEIEVNLVSNQGWSVLMSAASHGHEGIVALLLARSEIEVNLVDSAGWSALMYAADRGHEGIVKHLLARHEIQVNLVDNEGWSVLIRATANGNEDTVKLLLACPAIQVNKVSKKGWSALMHAAHKGHEGVATLLLAHPDIQVNLVSSKRWSALMLAAANGHEGIVKVLLARPEIQVNLADDEGFSALMWAAEWGHESIVRLLLDVPHIDTATMSTGDGHTAMSLALAYGHPVIVQLLQDHELQQAGSAPDLQHLSAGTVMDVGTALTSKSSGQGV
ncbi:ankyrin repeat-containing domain protein [Coprinopsis sp. MPI-PUGE-AT-0042]|nr:ankyrin repeat-containing domain protein [Coprinopsis sp. MPI-PUGE-AT-0042]